MGDRDAWTNTTHDWSKTVDQEHLQVIRDHAADYAATVHAVEIGPAIAAKLREALPSPALTVTVGDFEQIDVGEDRFDALFSATAATK